MQMLHRTKMVHKVQQKPCKALDKAKYAAADVILSLMKPLRL
jgi:hypothetical protein